MTVCGLDSIIARRWINGMIVSMLEYSEDGVLDMSSIRPIVDGGTEGFKGNARVILPGVSACIECTLELYPPQVIKVFCFVGFFFWIPIYQLDTKLPMYFLVVPVICHVFDTYPQVIKCSFYFGSSFFAITGLLSSLE